MKVNLKLTKENAIYVQTKRKVAVVSGNNKAEMRLQHILKNQAVLNTLFFTTLYPEMQEVIEFDSNGALTASDDQKQLLLQIVHGKVEYEIVD